MGTSAARLGENKDALSYSGRIWESMATRPAAVRTPLANPIF